MNARVPTWLRRLAWGAGALLLVWALAWLAVPPLLKWQGEKQLGALLGRTVTLGEVDFRPWTLELTVRDIVVGAAPAASAASAAGAGDPLLRAQRLHVNAQLGSIVQRAPVIEELELDGLQLRVAHTAPGHYDIDDLIERLTPASAETPEDEPARFALHNLQLRDAALHFDDRPAGRVHVLDGVTLTLPFVSSLPSQVEVTVEPRLVFRLNGVPFDSGAQSTPFAQTHAGDLRLAFKDLDLAPYLGYLPASLPVRLRKGAVSADLRARFALPEGATPTVMLAGTAGARDVAVADSTAAPLLGWQQLSLDLRDVQPLARKLAFGTLRIEGLQMHLARSADGQLSVGRLAGTAATPARPAASSASAGAGGPARTVQPWQGSLEKFEIDGARVLWNDAATKPAAALQLDGIAMQMEQLAWPVQRPMPFKLAAALRSQAEGAPVSGSFTLDGTATDRDASAAVTVDALSLPALAPYLAQVLAPSVAGQVSLQGRLDWSGDATTPKLMFSAHTAALDGFGLSEGSGRAARQPAALKQASVGAVELDLLARRVTLDRLGLVQPSLDLARDRAGRWNVSGWVGDPGPPAAASSKAAPAAAAASAAWRVQVKEFALDGGRLRLTDAYAPGHATEAPVRVDLSGLRLRVQDLSWPGERRGAPARVQLDARIAAPAAPREKAGPAGSLAWNGRVHLEPLAANGSLRIDRLPIHLFEPYLLGEQFQLSVLHADAGWKGTVSAQSGARGWSVTAAGDAQLADVRVHTRPEPGTAAGFAAGDELMSWQSLAANGIRVVLKPDVIPQIEVREAALNDFYSRLVITEQGEFNLRDVGAPAGAASAPAGTASAPTAPTAPDAPAAAASAAPPMAAASAPPSGLPVDIAIGGVRLTNGRIDFTDRFIRPNYSADLTELNGQLGAFRSGTRAMATLELRGRAARTALLDIRGALNPTADPLALDIRALATDLELAPFSPYAGKYAGYAIERGKLSMEVAYKIDPDGKLEAKNQVILNQLTFGEKVDSPDATKLPVLLAVALLKDRNGVIDINLPISGSINDPQFSVFGIVLKVIGNLLVKALTAPFALLAGGGKDDLSLVEFRPGTALVTEGGASALDKVAKALTDRPSLKMTVTGAADPVSEREAYQQAALEARLLTEHRRELMRDGAEPAEADAVTVLDADTRAKVLKEVYRKADLPDKPRNALGFARDIPGPAMEALLKARGVVTAEAMRELALQRGLAVRDALVAKGLPSERLFLAAPKLRASGDDDAAWTPRVQLALSVN